MSIHWKGMAPERKVCSPLPGNLYLYVYDYLVLVKLELPTFYLAVKTFFKKKISFFISFWYINVKNNYLK